MSMNGIDTSSYQAALSLPGVTYDFVVTKATEGTTYVNPYCDVHFQQAKAQGKKRGVYHFIDFSADILSQADTFVKNCRGYIGDAIFVLDWEGANVDRVQDALTFLRRVRDRIGYNPAIYMSEYVENSYDWSPVVNEDFGLWIAKYSDYEIDNNYDMSQAGKIPTLKHWSFYFMWQWTSKGRLSGYAGDLDCDIAYIDGAAWDKYAGVQAAPVPTVPDPTPTPQPTPTEDTPTVDEDDDGLYDGILTDDTPTPTPTPVVVTTQPVAITDVKQTILTAIAAIMAALAALFAYLHS